MAGPPKDPQRPGTPAAPGSQPTDVGKTSGGGSLGHDQPDDVADEAHIRNQGTRREGTGGTRETVVPADEAH